MVRRKLEEPFQMEPYNGQVVLMIIYQVSSLQ